MSSHESCPLCFSSHTDVVESRLCSNGTRRRRHNCLHCGHRWTVWDGQRPSLAAIARQKMKPPGRQNTARLTAAQVRVVLLARDVTHYAMAKQVGFSPETIRQVRYGATHAKLHPEIARWAPPASGQVVQPANNEPSCYACRHWNDRCAFGFPDPLQEGPGFAADCDLYDT